MFLLRTSLFLLFGTVLVLGQSNDYYYPGQEQRYDDPLRRTLGLLGRVLNRMAQKDPPTDEQLHFQVSDPPDIKVLNSILRQQRTGPDRIVSEELLNKLIPRVKGQTSPPRTTPTTTPKPKKVTKTTTTPTTTTTTATTTTTTPTTTTTTTTEPTTTTTTVPETTTVKVAEKPKENSEKSSLTVRVKSLQEMAKHLPANSELNDEDLKQAQIIAEALRILLNQEANATKVSDKSKETAEDSVSSEPVEMISTSAPSTTTESENTTESTKEESTEDTENAEEVEEAEEDESEESEGEDETNEESKSTTESVDVEQKTTTRHPVFENIGRINIPEAEEEDSSLSSETVNVGFQEAATSTSTPQGQTVYNLNVSVIQQY